ncbi:uncharacterized protein LOC127284337 [Leptopilina boulardi]|uniref:uncharacterized protein LOC127284337 n=1 Tax=Leptopilina boulardi TaxID=63433 RepID=UPI0021F53627|nr:uncharacterized protein LOC127284337 [Leptopilina boulardi]
MMMFIESGIRGGISQFCNRYAKANNPYMDQFDPAQDAQYIMYFDANHLYGWAMAQTLPIGGFKCNANPDETIDFNIPDDSSVGYMLEVDLEYLEILHDSQDMPFCAVNAKPPMSKQEKLLTTLLPKENRAIFDEDLVGIKAGVLKKSIQFDDYVECLRNFKIQARTQYNIRSRLHDLETVKRVKVALSPHDDKSYQYCGPGTKLIKRLVRGDTGINPLEEACKEHDNAYLENHNNVQARNAANKIFADKAWQRVLGSDSSVGEKDAALAISGTLKVKSKLDMEMRRKKTSKNKKIQTVLRKIIDAARHSIIPGNDAHSTIKAAVENARKAIRRAGGRKQFIKRENVFLHAGPALQTDIALVLLNWRRHRIVSTADIVKMFRKILVHPKDRDLQRILLRPSAEMPIEEYRLFTVTYGTACAPFVAIRTLKQLVIDEGAQFPLGAECLQENTYVDDIFDGDEDVLQAEKKRNQVVDLCAKGNLKLDKWATNHPKLLPSSCEPSSSKIIDQNSIFKTLGILWDSNDDHFTFNIVQETLSPREVSKRTISSCIARLYDPLSWLSPITVVAKIMLQEILSISSCTIECQDPTLELCGAVLLTRLLQHVRKLFHFKDATVTAWCDSQVTLAWINQHPSRWKTFVANRVSYIQTELPSAVWRHVPNHGNPADLATRGLLAEALQDNQLWWKGPQWLSLPPNNWPSQHQGSEIDNSEVQSFLAVNPEINDEILSRFSSLQRLFRVVAYCLRVYRTFKVKASGDSVKNIALSASELESSKKRILTIAQTKAFAEDIAELKKGKSVPKNSVIRDLNPFLDEEGVLRIWLIKFHVTESSSQPAFPFPIDGRSAIAKNRTGSPISDFGPRLRGAFPTTDHKGTSFKSYKGYIVVFVCFATKAIHLEAVSDMTSATFLAAYRRFTGRRGLCRQIFSDNGTTFQGADKELRSMFKRGSAFYSYIAGTLANDGTDWRFIPPNSPHFGGLWEAGVKSAKHHLTRMMLSRSFTFEEFSTLLVEIEACLNSRPLCDMSTDPEELNALTPTHFLIGSTLAILPDEEPPKVPVNRLERYQLLQKIRNKFWRKWSQEYLQSLQARGKWQQSSENLSVGQLVLIRDDRYPPTKWPLGKIIEVHPGSDGKVRVVTVKTTHGTYRRPIVRLSPLPSPT